MEFLGLAVVDALEAEPGPERPVDRVSADAQHAFQLVDQRQRIARRAVHLVHERENGDSAAAADLEQFAGLGFDAFARVDDHHHGVHGRQHAVGVLGEIFVAGRVQEVDAVAVVVELEHRGADRDAALALQFHPVRGGRALVLAVRHRPRKLHRPAVKQQLLGKGRLARVGMGNDGEGAAPGYFSLHGWIEKEAGVSSKSAPGASEDAGNHRDHASKPVGFSAISRWLSAATPPEQDRASISPRKGWQSSTVCCHPVGVNSGATSNRWCR